MNTKDKILELQDSTDKEILTSIYNMILSNYSNSKMKLFSRNRMNQLVTSIVNKKPIRMACDTIYTGKCRICFVWSKYGLLTIKTNMDNERKIVNLDMLETEIFVKEIYNLYSVFNNYIL